MLNINILVFQNWLCNQIMFLKCLFYFVEIWKVTETVTCFNTSRPLYCDYLHFIFTIVTSKNLRRCHHKHGPGFSSPGKRITRVCHRCWWHAWCKVSVRFWKPLLMGSITMFQDKDVVLYCIGEGQTRYQGKRAI